jgi:glycosyltransferase involved in cell wall biosynthesis
VTPPSLGPHPDAFTPFKILVPHVAARYDTVWIRPKFVPPPNRHDFFQMLHNLLLSAAIRTNVSQGDILLLEPQVPYFQYYLSKIQRYDKNLIRIWSLIANAIANRVKVVLKRLRPEICLSTHPLGGLLGSILKQKKLITYHVYYDWDRYSAFYKHDLSPQINYLEDYIVTSADMVWSVSRTLARLRKSAGAKRVLTVPHGVNTFIYGQAIRLRESRRMNNVKAPLTVAYVGSISPNWGVDTLLDAFELLMNQRQDLKLILAGPATNILAKHIQVLQRNYGNNIEYLGVVHWSEVYKILSIADVGVAPYRSGGSAEYGVPLKIKEYVAAGLPVISTCVGEIPTFLEKNGVGVTCEDSSHDLARTIRCIMENDDLRGRLEKNAARLNLPSYEEVFHFAFTRTFEALGVSDQSVRNELTPCTP